LRDSPLELLLALLALAVRIHLILVPIVGQYIEQLPCGDFRAGRRSVRLGLGSTAYRFGGRKALFEEGLFASGWPKFLFSVIGRLSCHANSLKCNSPHCTTMLH